MAEIAEDSASRSMQSSRSYNSSMILTAERVLFEDHHLIVVNKPAPLLTQSPPGVPSLEAMVKAYIRLKYAKPAGVYLAVPHRLDRPVSGVICFARNTKAGQRVHQQFHDRTVAKVYWALVEGHVSPMEGEWQDWLRKVPGESRTLQCLPGEPQAKLATLNYRVLELNADHTHLELLPSSGRMHQLRSQCAWHGHSVLGDLKYGSTKPFGGEADDDRDRVIALHARKLEIDHPFTKERIAFEAPLPEYWAR